LRLKKSLPERTTILFLAGNILIALGLICDTWLPINKKLWTSSFALFMAGRDNDEFADLALQDLLHAAGLAVQRRAAMGCRLRAVDVRSRLRDVQEEVVRSNLILWRTLQRAVPALLPA
jgi:hypothetical protein